MQRMGQGPQREASEEVRLQLARLLVALLRPPSASQPAVQPGVQPAVQQQLGGLVACACSGVSDASPEIKRVSVSCAFRLWV